MRGLASRRVRFDGIWAFAGAKKENTTAGQRRGGRGCAWVWVALGAESKLCVSRLVGGRDAGWGRDFVQGVAPRPACRAHLTADGHKLCLEAVEGSSARTSTPRPRGRFMARRAKRKRGANARPAASAAR